MKIEYWVLLGHFVMARGLFCVCFFFGVRPFVLYKKTGVLAMDTFLTLVSQESRRRSLPAVNKDLTGTPVAGCGI